MQRTREPSEVSAPDDWSEVQYEDKDRFEDDTCGGADLHEGEPCGDTPEGGEDACADKVPPPEGGEDAHADKIPPPEGNIDFNQVLEMISPGWKHTTMLWQRYPRLAAAYKDPVDLLRNFTKDQKISLTALRLRRKMERSYMMRQEDAIWLTAAVRGMYSELGAMGPNLIEALANSGSAAEL